jgi:hypothetical protein
MAYKFKDGQTFHMKGDLFDFTEDKNYPACQNSCDIFSKFIETDHERIQFLTDISWLRNRKTILGVRFKDILNSIRLNVLLSFDIFKLKTKLWKLNLQNFLKI